MDSEFLLSTRKTELLHKRRSKLELSSKTLYDVVLYDVVLYDDIV